MLCVSDGIAGCVWPGIPEPTEWEHLGDQINTAFIFARSDFVNVRESARLLRCVARRNEKQALPIGRVARGLWREDSRRARLKGKTSSPFSHQTHLCM